MNHNQDVVKEPQNGSYSAIRRAKYHADPAYRARVRANNDRWNARNTDKIAAASKARMAATPKEVLRERWRKNNVLYYDPTKSSARQKVKHALRVGALTRPTACHDCQKQCKPQAHHIEYALPLVVVWLCTRCHGKRHSGKGPVDYLGAGI